MSPHISLNVSRVKKKPSNRPSHSKFLGIQTQDLLVMHPSMETSVIPILPLVAEQKYKR